MEYRLILGLEMDRRVRQNEYVQTTHYILKQKRQQLRTVSKQKQHVHQRELQLIQRRLKTQLL